MIDAYDLQQQLRAFWGELSRIVSGSDVKKTFPQVPVHVLVNGKLHVVDQADIVEGKIILKTEDN